MAMSMDNVYLSELYDEDDNSLEHHGVQGMKWGVRRYQNKDGSLTSEGRKHVQAKDGKSVISNFVADKKAQASNAVSKWRVKRSEKKAENKVKRTEISQNKKNARKAVKNPLNMTDKELQRTIDRMKLEKEYRDLDREKHSGRTYVIDTFKTVGTKLLTDPNTYVRALTGLYYLSQGKTPDIALEEQKTKTAAAGNNKKKNND